MKHEEIRTVLKEALEEEIPSSQVNLWPAVRASLVAGNHQRVRQGVKMETKRVNRVTRFAAAAAMLAVLLAAALLTPQGRAFSQSLLQFFRQAEDATLPLPPSQTAAGATDPSAPTAEPPAPLVSAAEAATQAGFAIAELPSVPDGLVYLGVRVYGGAAHVEYRTEDYAGYLIIKQSQGGFVESSWDSVPADQVVPVTIGEWEGEFAQGAFIVYADGTGGTWNPDAPLLRLRWVQDGVRFEMTKSGDAGAIAYLDQAGMVELAESLTLKP